MNPFSLDTLTNLLISKCKTNALLLSALEMCVNKREELVATMLVAESFESQKRSWGRFCKHWSYVRNYINWADPPAEITETDFGILYPEDFITLADSLFGDMESIIVPGNGMYDDLLGYSL